MSSFLRRNPAARCSNPSPIMLINLLSNSKNYDHQTFASAMKAISKSSSPGVSSVRGAKGIVDVDVSQLPDKKLRQTRNGPNMCRVTTKCSIINNLSNLRDCLNLVTASLSAFTLAPAASTPLPSSSTWNLVIDSDCLLSVSSKGQHNSHIHQIIFPTNCH